MANDDPQFHDPDGAPAGTGYEVVWTPDPAAVDVDAELPARYELARDFGDGVAGPVFGVRDRESAGKLVRLELLPARLVPTEARAKELHERMAAARRIVSAHVARVRDVGQLDDGRTFVVSDAVRGETLHERLRRDRALHPRHALEVTRQILLGLAGAHEQGVVHGALTAREVWLAGGAPKTDADPHGVAVRIADFGLAGYVAAFPLDGEPRAGGAPEDDVRAALALLRAMLPDGGDGPLATEIERIVARGAGSETRAPELKSVLAEVERALESAPNSAPVPERHERPQRPAPRWPLAVAAALLVVAGAEAFLLWRGTDEVRASADDARAAAERSRRLSADLEAARGEVLSLTAQRDAALEQKSKTEKSATQAFAAERERAAGLMLELERSRSEVDQAQRAQQVAELEAETAARRTRELNERVLTLERASSPAARAARGFEAALVAIENRSGDEAARRIAALESDGLPSPLFARELAAAAQALERFDHSRGSESLDAAALRDAERSLERAVAARSTLSIASAPWLEYFEGGSEAFAARAEAALASLDSALEEARAEARRVDDEDWAKVALGSGVQDPRPAFEHAQRFGCRHIDELATRFANELRAWVIVEGSLDVDRLQTFHHLPDWLDRIDRGDVRLPERGVSELALFERAQRWYDLDPENDGGFDWGGVERASVTSLRKDWRNELYLQSKLAQPESGFPIRRNTTLYYKSTGADGAVEWWRERCESPGTSAWRIHRERLSADATKPVGDGWIQVERKGAVFAIPGASVPLLDLRAHGESVMVAPLPNSITEPLPAALEVSADEVELFRRAAQGEPCLVFVQSDVRRWISPRWGLVREETLTAKGWIARELAFATPWR